MGATKNENILVSFNTALNFSLLENARREMKGLPSIDELKRSFSDTSRWDERILNEAQKLLRPKPKRRPIKILKQVFIAIMVLICLFTGTMLVSAEVRNAVINTLIEWTGIDIGIRFEVEGHALTALPEGYQEHYVPQGFVLQTEESFDSDINFFHVYRNLDDRPIIIDVQIAENASVTRMDNEHTDYDKITFNDVTAYLGHFTDVTGKSGYRMIWAKDGIEHWVEAYTNLSEFFKIAESIG